MVKKTLVVTGLAAVLSMAMAMTTVAAPFDAAYYAAKNPDVVAVVGNDPVLLEMHYQTFGAAEGRTPNATDAPAGRSASSAFDAAYYAAQNPDVAALLGNDPVALQAHYEAFGKAEGRMPSAAAAVAAKKSSGSSAAENPYARFAGSSGSSSKKSSKKSSTSSSSTGTKNPDSEQQETVTVSVLPNEMSVEVGIGGSETTKATVLVNGRADTSKTVHWAFEGEVPEGLTFTATGDTATVTVGPNVAAGTYGLMASVDGAKPAEFCVMIDDPIGRVELDQSEVTVSAGNTVTVRVKVFDCQGVFLENKGVRWIFNDGNDVDGITVIYSHDVVLEISDTAKEGTYILKAEGGVSGLSDRKTAECKIIVKQKSSEGTDGGTSEGTDGGTSEGTDVSTSEGTNETIE